MKLDPWRWLKRLTAPTLFRVLPIDPALERDELLARIRRELYGHGHRGEHLTKRAATELIDLIDEFQDRETERIKRHPVKLSATLDYGRPVDTTRPPLPNRSPRRRR